VNKRFQVWLPLLFAIVMVWGMIIGYGLQRKMGGGSAGNAGISGTSGEVLELIKEKYVDKENMDSLNVAAIEAILNKLDPHSLYIPPMLLADVNNDLRGSLLGVGIKFQMYNDTLNVTEVLENGPALKAGIETGDQVIKINDSTISGRKKESEEIRSLLRGEGGSSVDLTLFRNNKPVTVNVKRGIVPIPSLDAAYMAAPGVGYLKLNKFSETTYTEFMQAMEKLQKQGMKKLMLDLRDNGGGVLSAAVNIADEFLEDGKMIVYTEGDKTPKKEYKSSKPGVFEKGALVVLMNESSASASEVLAGALQDNDRCTIIGRRSFGKGLVQEQYQLSNGGALRLTVSRYYTPLGRSIQRSYAQGRKTYNEEILERFHHRDSTYSDSIYTKGKAYKTEGGKTVYGGGGISPDVYVSFDTATLSRAGSALFNSGTLSSFSFKFYNQNKQLLQPYKSIQSYETGFTLPTTTWDNLVDFARKDSIILPATNAKLKNESLQQVKALLALRIWHNEGYYEIENSEDTTYKKALQVIESLKN
jgi:carboxyl-terminal processing protease